jgi:hypothetical protein
VRGQRGSVPIEFALGVGVLVLPVALLVLTLPGWVERQMVARLAAQQAARLVVLEGEADVAAVARLVDGIAANHGVPAGDVAVEVAPSPAPGAVVTAAVTVRVPVAVVPGFGPAGGFTLRAAHSVRVDDYRSLP